MPTLILDFDGTVCIGDEPALHYAHTVAALTRAAGLAGLAAAGELEARTRSFLAGRPLPGHEAADDGYMAVWLDAVRIGVPIEIVRRAFLDTRTRIAHGELAVAAPAGLRALLDELRAGGTIVSLVTNAPLTGLDAILARIGLAGAFDSVRADAGKPHGMTRVLDALLPGEGGDARGILSIGDIWENDLRVPFERGAATALIDPLELHRGTPAVRARTLPELYPWISDWVRSRATPAM